MRETKYLITGQLLSMLKNHASITGQEKSAMYYISIDLDNKQDRLCLIEDFRKLKLACDDAINELKEE